MSVKLQQAIFSGENRDLFSDIKGADLNVLLYLAWCANENQNMRCDPAIDTIAKAIHLSPRQVIRIIDGLTKRKLITIDRGPGRSNRYIFSFAPSPDNHSTADLVRMGRAMIEGYGDEAARFALDSRDYIEAETTRLDKWQVAYNAMSNDDKARYPYIRDRFYYPQLIEYGKLNQIDSATCNAFWNYMKDLTISGDMRCIDVDESALNCIDLLSTWIADHSHQ